MEDNELQAIGKRIRLVRKTLGIRQRKMAEEILYSQTYLSEIEAGKRIPKSRMIKTIAGKYSVNPEWLMTGKGEMFVHSKAESETMDVSGQPDVRVESSALSEVQKAIVTLAMGQGDGAADIFCELGRRLSAQNPVRTVSLCRSLLPEPHGTVQAPTNEGSDTARIFKPDNRFLQLVAAIVDNLFAEDFLSDTERTALIGRLGVGLFSYHAGYTHSRNVNWGDLHPLLEYAAVQTPETAEERKDPQ